MFCEAIRNNIISYINNIDDIYSLKYCCAAFYYHNNYVLSIYSNHTYKSIITPKLIVSNNSRILHNYEHISHLKVESSTYLFTYLDFMLDKLVNLTSINFSKPMYELRMDVLSQLPSLIELSCAFTSVQPYINLEVLPNLQSLVCTYCDISYISYRSYIKNIDKLTQLKQLKLINCCNITKEELNKLTNLTKLDLFDYYDDPKNNNIPMRDIIMRSCTNLTNLTELTLRYGIETPLTLMFPKLKKLNCGKFNYTDYHISHLENLEELYCSRYGNYTDSSIIQFSNLKILELNNCSNNITDKSLSTLSKLTRLSLSDSNCFNITDHSFINKNKLISLKCGSVEITDEALKMLPNLTRLDLSNNTSITDNGIKTLTKLVNLLCKNNHNITNDSITQLPLLQELYCGTNTNITHEIVSPKTKLEKVQIYMLDIIYHNLWMATCHKYGILMDHVIVPYKNA